MVRKLASQSQRISWGSETNIKTLQTHARIVQEKYFELTTRGEKDTVVPTSFVDMYICMLRYDSGANTVLVWAQQKSYRRIRPTLLCAQHQYRLSGADLQKFQNSEAAFNAGKPTTG